MSRRKEIHSAGEVWASMLNEMYWNLVDNYGYSDNLYDATQTKGNIVAIQLIFGGFSNQPCNPTFLQARDAILISDNMFYSGVHNCDIWAAFAKRGMGVNAKEYKNSFEVPQECQKKLKI